MADLSSVISQMNSSALQDRVSAGRNQKDEIRARLANPGLYQAEATAASNTDTSQTDDSQLSDVISYLQNSGAYGSGGGGEGSKNTGYSTPSSMGLNQSLADVVGYMTGKAVGATGIPGGSIAGSLLSGLLGEGINEGKVQNAALQTGLSMVSPQLSALYGLYNMAKSLHDSYTSAVSKSQGSWMGKDLTSDLLGISGKITGETGSGGSWGNTTPGYSSGDLGGGITTGANTGLSLGGFYGGYSPSESGGLQGAMSGTFGSDSSGFGGDGGDGGD